MIYVFYALAVIAAPFIVLGLGWLLLILSMEFLYWTNRNIPYDAKRFRFVIWGLGVLLIKGWRFKYKVINKEYVPEKNVVMFGNHISAFDPVVLCYEFRHTAISGMAKKSLFNIPFFNKWLKKRRVVAMERTNNRKDAEAMIQAIRQAKEGQPMFVFPEGTRSRTGDLIEFRPGAFKLATKSKQDMVIFKFTGMNEHKWYHLWRKTCTLEFFPPIKYEEYKDMTTQEISDMVRSVLEG